jgi:predicted SAM-dependent methyltransferase
MAVKLYSNDSWVLRGRAKRMRDFQRLVAPPSKARIVDLGGSPLNWRLIEHDWHVTMVNLPGFNDASQSEPWFDLVDGDACDLTSQFEDQSFDVVFSNSTIEHVGDEEKQKQFAAEVHRLAPSHWIQTPSSRCPIEVHTGVPLYWQLPNTFRRRLHASWKRKLPGWFRMIEETRVLTRKQMQSLFPESRQYTERIGFIEKSYAYYRSTSRD